MGGLGLGEFASWGFVFLVVVEVVYELVVVVEVLGIGGVGVPVGS